VKVRFADFHHGLLARVVDDPVAVLVDPVAGLHSRQDLSVADAVPHAVGAVLGAGGAGADAVGSFGTRVARPGPGAVQGRVFFVAVGPPGALPAPAVAVAVEVVEPLARVEAADEVAATCDAIIGAILDDAAPVVAVVIDLAARTVVVAIVYARSIVAGPRARRGAVQPRRPRRGCSCIEAPSSPVRHEFK
jgi:hypothetical protein